MPRSTGVWLGIADHMHRELVAVMGHVALAVVLLGMAAGAHQIAPPFQRFAYSRASALSAFDGFSGID